MNLLQAAFGAALAYLAAAPQAGAQDVTLKSRDGNLEVQGTLLGYDGEFYRIESPFGVLTVDGSGVICTGPGCPDLEAFVARIRFSGAPEIGDALLPALIQAFAADQGYRVERQVNSDDDFAFVLREADDEREAARFEFRLTSSDEGFADVLSDEAQIAMSLREVLPEELARGEEAGLGRFSAPRQNRVIALDAVVPVVAPLNPVLEISLAELAAVYSGQITNWADIGGVDAPIRVHARTAGTGVSEVFTERVMLSAGRPMTRGAIEHDTNAELVDAVAEDPFSIGLAVLSDTGNTRSLTLAGGCGFRSGPVPEALKSEDYPITAPIFLYLGGRRLPAIGREFLRFTQSPAAQIAVLRAGFVDQAISRTPIDRQGNRLANAILSAGDDVSLADIQRMVERLKDWRRLSITFRFADGSTNLDGQSRSNVLLLARALETGTVGARELTFVGFSDGIGPAAANEKLSKERASAVRVAVLEEAATADVSQIPLRVEGFGEAMPMACDDADWGRRINRRVEVWAR